MKATAQFRALLREPGLIMAPGAYDALTARVVEREGFPAVYVGGLAAAASMLCLPDQSLITMTELLEHVRWISAAVRIPIIADIDDGGGNPTAVRRTVRLFEQAGVAAVHVEDVVPGKHYGRGGQLFPKELMVQKVKAAVEAREDPDFTIIARCDALTLPAVYPDPLAEAIDRGKAFAAAGADIIFLAGLQLKDMKTAADALPVPLLNVVRDTPKGELEANGLKVAIYFAQAVFLAYVTVRDLWRELKTTGTIKNLTERMAPMDEFNEVVGGTEGTALAQKYGVIT